MTEMFFNPGIVNDDPCLITIDVRCSLILSYSIIYGTPRPSPKICEEFGKFTFQIIFYLGLNLIKALKAPKAWASKELVID